MKFPTNIQTFFHKLLSIFSGISVVKKLVPIFASFLQFFSLYIHHKVMIASMSFEKQKNKLVRFFTIKRGRYNRPFLHIAAMVVLAVGIIIAPFLADIYPIFSSNQAANITLAQAQEQSISLDSDVFQTQISEKPRDKVIVYTVEKGDTISTIAKKYDISQDTIRWLNDLPNDNLTVGDELRIPPVTGIVHKVDRGESIYTIAKKYDISPQAIVDFPFNDFANPQTFALVEGQTLIVPDGVKPAEKVLPRALVFVPQYSGVLSAAGFTWPLRGSISQFASWYHMGIDITSPVGTPIVAAQNGTVVKASAGTWDGGYGTSVVIDNGSGWKSNYAHMSGLNVSAGDTVIAGKTVIGWVGLTGRTTGAHLHFEIIRGGQLVNPMQYLQ